MYYSQFLAVCDECREAKTKAIMITNHNRRKQQNEQIRSRSKYMLPASSTEKRVRSRHVWVWFCFPLAEQMARTLPTKVKLNQSKCETIFVTQLKTAPSVCIVAEQSNSLRHSIYNSHNGRGSCYGRQLSILTLSQHRTNL